MKGKQKGRGVSNQCSTELLEKTQPVQIVWEQPADHVNLLCDTSALIGQLTLRQLSNCNTSYGPLPEKGCRTVTACMEVLMEKGSKHVKKKASSALLREQAFLVS